MCILKRKIRLYIYLFINHLISLFSYLFGGGGGCRAPSISFFCTDLVIFVFIINYNISNLKLRHH